MFKFSQWGLFIKRLAEVSWLAVLIFFKKKLSGPERLRLFFERAGGAFVKFGQILSLRQDFLSASYIIELFKLSNKTPETPFEKMQIVFAKEKGVSIEAFFLEFNRAPFACAALSQVYEAKLKNGLPVAVKIQRPETKKIFEIDFAVVSFMAGVFDFFRVFSAVNLQEVVVDFIVWTKSELDFTLEAKNASTLYNHNLNHPFTVIPKQYPELSTPRVLIQEYIGNGLPVIDIVLNKTEKYDFSKNNIDRNGMATRLVCEQMRQYFVDGFFHADPHPANLLFLPGNEPDCPEGRLVYFDFGVVGKADASRALFLKILHGMAKKDIGFIAEYFMEFGRKILSEELEFYLKMDVKIRRSSEKIFKKIRELMLEDLKKEIGEILNPWFEAIDIPGSSREERSAAGAFFKIMEKVEQYGIHLPRETTLFFRSLSVSDMLALQISPDFDMIKALNFFFKNYSLEEIELAIKKGTHDEESGKKIVPPANADWEVFREISALEKEKMLVARERIISLIMHYAERYEEIRSMVKNL